jgi:long-chain fatty acid transport protein
VKTVDLTFAASFDFGSDVSFGLGLVYERAEATLSKAIDFGSRICSINVALCVSRTRSLRLRPQKNDGMIEVTGDDNRHRLDRRHAHPPERQLLAGLLAPFGNPARHRRHG